MVDRTYGLLKWLRGACVGTVMTLRVEAIPSPASRPRVSKFGTYYAKSYATFMAACHKQMAAQWGGEALTGPLASVAEIIIPKPKTGKRAWPIGDSDNYGKGVLDGATKAGVWIDDDHCVVPIPLKRYADPGEKPGVILHVGKLRQ